ncbi:hypothetical protein C3942_19195 [Solimonas fluminis]|uniref:DUF3293 domain-containing protein n=1 Tax=Solimonas fluminis TaxID=2086571 RepID=A0A2S5TBA1_9GAMM|nr:DUF3293 domain-containing protein [Solimonas fluminis]PPE72235.1 hypothetical protein C3942_19195 [Solimonas fluminis]
MNRAGLEKAYRQALYLAWLPDGELVLRVGPADPQADRRLAGSGSCRRNWALLTPCNPRSERLDAAANQRLYNQLEGELHALSQAWHRSLHRDPSGQWPDEPGFLLIDPPPERAVELGRRYRQNAIVAAELGQESRVVWLDDAAM